MISKATAWTVNYYNFGTEERYYLQRLGTVQWTTLKEKALKFHSEQDAEIARYTVLRGNAPLFPVSVKEW